MRVQEYVRLTSSVFAVFVGLSAVVGVALVGQTASQAGTSPRTPWGEPDLQGIWTEEFDIPLERPERYGNREFLTDEEYAEIDQRPGQTVSPILGLAKRDDRFTVEPCGPVGIAAGCAREQLTYI